VEVLTGTVKVREGKRQCLVVGTYVVSIYDEKEEEAFKREAEKGWGIFHIKHEQRELSLLVRYPLKGMLLGMDPI
jgi:hypothetical protein